MKNSISYKNCLIRGESFQLAQSSGWIPRYTLTRQDAMNKWNGAPSHYDRLDQVFWTENEADKFALQDAMRWIDQNAQLQR
ncbi:MAG TPA: hypothetical protein VKR81_11230 [Candidatus Binatia bacterium]|nr:hypothetical protein [Candidatus Binatia bacterium]